MKLKFTEREIEELYKENIVLKKWVQDKQKKEVEMKDSIIHAGKRVRCKCGRRMKVFFDGSAPSPFGLGRR